ncbi:uncharacterized protein LOC135814269 [Sycon ciliatum]|uniref:uncharacterized protein LOC135814269 n=1 Tax=Sycon ciliatum TaxID=27933 RepID=UPI0031F67381
MEEAAFPGGADPRQQMRTMGAVDGSEASSKAGTTTTSSTSEQDRARRCYACHHEQVYGAGRRRAVEEGEIEFALTAADDIDSSGGGNTQRRASADFMARLKGKKTYTYVEPPFVSWSAEEVGEWMSTELKLPQYAPCFVDNLVTGRRLALVDTTALVRMGMRNWDDIKFVSENIRQLVGRGPEVCIYHRNAADREVPAGVEFLWRRSRYGSGDQLRYEQTDLATCDPY